MRKTDYRRHTSYKLKKTLKEDAVNFLSFNDFDDQNPDNYGLSGSATHVERIFPPEKNTQKTDITGNSCEQSDKLYELIENMKLI